MGTTTAIAMVPPFDNPLLELEGIDVADEVDEDEVVEAEFVVEVAGVEVEVGSNVLVDV
jgi:hypothetical protein